MTFQKGDGKLILGDDLVALVCHNCEKIYCFNDVKYKEKIYENIKIIVENSKLCCIIYV